MTKCDEIDNGDSDYGEYHGYISAEIEAFLKAGYSCEEIQESLKEEQAKMTHKIILDEFYLGRFENGVIEIGKAASIPLMFKYLK